MAWPLIEWPLPLAATVRFDDRAAALITVTTSSWVAGWITARGLTELRPPKSLTALGEKSMVPWRSRASERLTESLTGIDSVSVP